MAGKRIPMEVIEHILSFLPVKDPRFDNCMDQILYFGSELDYLRRPKWKGNHAYYKNTSFHSFILKSNRYKMLMKGIKLKLKIEI